MTGLPPRPQLVTLCKPLLADYIVVAHQLSELERRQWVALSDDGAPFDADRCATQLANIAGPKWSLIRPDGQAFATGGLFYVRDGVWQEWLIATPECWTRYGVSATKHCKGILKQMLATEAHRIQCVSLAQKTRAHQWYRVLGFEPEGTLRGYGANGEDCVMFAMTDGRTHVAPGEA